MSLAVFFALLLGAVTLLLAWLKHRQGYWRRRGIPHNAPSLLLGNMGDWIKSKHISEIFVDTYRQFKGQAPFAGFYFMLKRSAIILDPELVKNILIKDFNTFQERGLFYNERDDPLTGNLFFLDGEKWRQLRHKMSPTFTSGKMKFMFPTVLKVGEELVQVLKEKLDAGATAEGEVLEITALLGRFTADVIGSCAFGLECNSLRQPDAEFVAMGKRFLLNPRHSEVLNGFMHTFPSLARRLRMRIVDQQAHEFYMRIVRETIACREQQHIKRNDFMDMLIEMRQNKIGSDAGLTDEEVAAQAFVFFLAGFETSSTTMGFALYELARHPQVQNKARAEINEVLARHNGQLSYECMKEMPYLDQIIDETLRMHPIVPHLIRQSNQRYETGDPKYYIDSGTFIIIPLIAIQRDPDIYPEPDQFQPERFAPEEVSKRASCTWLPFGEGPRNCIGMRFGKMQVCIGLAYLLQHFKFSVSPETTVPYKLILKNILLSAENGIHLNVQRVT